MSMGSPPPGDFGKITASNCARLYGFEHVA